MAIKVLHFGLGPIGAATARQVAARPGLRIVGGIDIDPAKAGRDIGDVVGLGRSLSAPVWADPVAALKRVRPDVVILCTSSSLVRILPQIETVLRARIPIVSTTEELAYPAKRNRAAVAKIDAWAQHAKVAVLGTGVNPGFAMDVLPIVLTAPCERVDAIRVERVQDARIRRLPFQQKIGASLTVGQFRRRVADGKVRHVGLTESVQMIADAMGWRLTRIVDRIQPKVALRAIASEWITVKRGQVCGLVQDGIGYAGGKPVITLHMEAYLGAPETYDEVAITGSPMLTTRVAGGIHGDIATAAIVVNSIPKILAAPPGYRTMRDLPIPSFFRGA
ncbi:MAG TPA: hypothetical protein VGG27_01045 [Magnetospirillaceae bacterium]|jgi:4-hydroxy-tetrahydrodipicolinate reductase